MHFLPFAKLSYLKPTLKFSVLSVMVAALSGCGGGSKDSDSFFDDVFWWKNDAAGVTQVSGQVFGPIAAATLTVTSPTDTNNINLFVEENKTDSNGKFTLANKFKTPIKADSYYLLSAYQGKYLDVNGDGVIDNTSTDSKGIVSGLVKGSQLEKNTLKLSLLTDIAWRYSKYHINDFSSQDIETRLTDIANVFFTQDISGDNVIDDKDLLAFDPTNSKHLQRLSFNYSFLFNKDKGDLINAYLQGDDAKIDEVIDSLFGLYLSRYQGKDARSNQVKIEVLPFGKGNYASDDGKITYKSDGSIKALSSFYDKKNDFVTITANPDTDTQILDWSGCYSVSEDKTKCQVSTLADTQVVVSFGYKEAKIVDNYIDLSRARSAFDGDSKIHVTVNHGDDELVTKMQSLQQGYFVTGMAEYGYLRKVTAITKLSDYKYTLETEEASLDEVVLQGTGMFSKQFTSADVEGFVGNLNDTTQQRARSVQQSARMIQSLNMPQETSITPATPTQESIGFVSKYEGVSLIPSESNTIKLQFGHPINQRAKTIDGEGGLSYDKKYEAVKLEYEVNGKKVEFSIEGELAIKLGLDIGVDYAFLKGLQSIKVVPNVSTNGNLTAKLGGEINQDALYRLCSKSPKSVDGKCKFLMGSVKLQPITYFIGPVPVYIHNYIDIYFNPDGKVEGEVTAFIDAGLSAGLGFLWHKDTGLTPMAKFKPDFNAGFTAKAKAEFKPALVPTFKAYFYGVTGPEIPLEVYLKATAEVGVETVIKKQKCEGGIDYSVLAGVGAKMEWGSIGDTEDKMAKAFKKTLGKLKTEFGANYEFELLKGNWGGVCTEKKESELRVAGKYVNVNSIISGNTIVTIPYTITNSGNDVLSWKANLLSSGTAFSLSQSSGTVNPNEKTIVEIKIEQSKLTKVGVFPLMVNFENISDNAKEQSFFEKNITKFATVIVKPDTLLSTPTDFTAELFKPTIALLKWSYPDNAKYGYLVKGYRVFISEDGTEWEMYQTITDKNRHFLHVPNLLTKKTYYFAIDAYGDDISSEVVKKELFVPAIVPTGDCRAHFSGGLMADAFESSGISEVYVEDRFSEYVGPGLYPDNNQAFPKAVSTTFDGIAIDTGTKVTIYSQKDFKGEVLYEKVGPAIINNSIWRNDGRYGPPVERNWKEPLQTTYPQSVREWSVGNMHSWSSGSLMIECGYSK
ncbi:MAG: fibronectin type III domain-containing protein [Moraxellaceae bacterium]|nr:fibronectin type III domain-containing protein [Pseudomonadales bacterium]MCP5175945.1 fibronectin type III domain-containing protein [Moraxellaceae bacterium]